ncbi:MAG TPA: hypothetical protein DCZ94_04460 [Lentisphaeria bacterium]|nr:MAG: hypothetical protein A2X48_20310 [Lentisphaerae bacterium GWF2_49_21]HBC86189.1 hypothetical protein [Lentisphaeria bacterium]
MKYVKYLVMTLVAMVAVIGQNAEAAFLTIDNTKTGLEALVFNPSEIVSPLLIIIASLLVACIVVPAIFFVWNLISGLLFKKKA